MNQTGEGPRGPEPSLHTVEMVCDRLAELGLAVGPDTARELVRAVLAAEAPRVDARLREALDTALQTIRVAAQAAMGVLATTTPESRPQSQPRNPPQQRVASQTPTPRKVPALPEPRGEPRPEPRRSPPELDDLERRPVIRRPGRR